MSQILKNEIKIQHIIYYSQENVLINVYEN